MTRHNGPTQQLRDMIAGQSDNRFPAFAWPGGYEILYLTEDNSVLCHNCANRENGSDAYIGYDPSGELGSDPQWHIVGHDCHWEGPPIQCDHCQRDIESCYGDPDEEDKPMTPKDFADYAESVEYRNQQESGYGDYEGDWFYGDDETLTVYTGTFGNNHSPGASFATYHDTYETRAEYDARMAKLEAMPEYLEDEDDDEKTLHCDGCQMLSINGVPCHETGCPEAWKDHDVECLECGCDFRPESRHQKACPECLNPEPFDDDDYADRRTRIGDDPSELDSDD